MLPLLIPLTLSSIMGIDLGDSYIKASVATATQTLHMGLNLQGKRYMPFYFSFWNRTRASNSSSLYTWTNDTLNGFEYDFGFIAKDQCHRFPKTCIKGLPKLNETYFGFKGYEILALELDSFVKSIRKTENIQDSIQVVLTVPPGLDPRDKALIRISCVMAGLEVLQFIDSTTAPSYTYSLERKNIYKNKSINVAFVDIGSKTSSVSIFNFDNSTEGTNSVTQLAVAYNNTIGGNDIDYKLAHIVAKANNISLDDHTTLMNMINDVSAAKEALALHPSVDIQLDFDVGFDEFPILSITRQQLEKAAQLYTETIIDLAKKALEMSNLTKVDRIELVGGGSRCIFLRDPLKQILGVDDVSRTLNQDFANAIGAGYAAAYKSPMFRAPEVNRSLMITTPAYATAGTHGFPIFQIGDDEAGSPSIITNCGPNSTFSIITPKGEFARFYIENVTAHDKVEIQYVHSYLLFPLPYKCIQQKDNQELNIKLMDFEWAPTEEDLKHSQDVVDTLIDLQNKRRALHKIANELEEFLIQIKHIIESQEYDNMPTSSKLHSVFTEHNDWFENLNGEATEEEYKSRLATLHKELDEIVDEIIEGDKQPKAIKKLKKSLDGVKELLASAALSPTVNQTELAIAKECYDQTEQLLSEYESSHRHSKYVLEARSKLKETVLPIRKFMRKQQQKAADESKLALM